MIELQKKYGCLTVLDLGEEYSKSEKYMSLLAEEELLKNEIKKIKEKRDLLKNENPIAFESYKQNGIIDPEFHLRFSQLNYDLSTMVQRLKAVASKIELHYKCRCRCGKTHYYNEKTLESKPKYCIYPIPISTSYTYSIRAQNATSRKREKYENIECVVLADKSKCMPSDEFCDIYNEYKTKQLENKEIVREKEKSRIPRVKANNYDIDYVGKHYETLFVEECTDENLEDEPSYSLKQRHNKHRHTIIVHRQYRCRCTLCGKEQYVNCDDFGIYPPTEYGIHAYNGYWSKVSCECHKISSFQWMVNKLLFENNVTYLPEYSFPDLYGVSAQLN